MKAKPALALAAFLVPLLAGCFGGSDDTGPALPPTATDSDLAGAAPYTIFLCNAGYRIGAAASQAGIDECNHRVTHPLVDNHTMDWTTQHGPGNEVSVAVNPTNPLNVAGGAKDYTVSYLGGGAGCGKYNVWMGTFSSLDGGLTWNDDLMPGFPGDKRPSAISGNTCNTDPVVAFDDDGTFVFSGLNYGGAHAGQVPSQPNPVYPGSTDATTATQIYFATSTDGGKTFGAISFCGVGDNGIQFNDKQWFALQPGGDHAIVTWTPYYSTPPLPSGVPDPTGLLAQSTSVISYCESMDGGKTWGPQHTFAPGTSSGLDSQFSMPQYLPNGPGGMPRVAVIWAADTDGTLPVGVHPNGDQLSYTEGTVTPGGTVFAPVMSTFTISPIKSDPSVGPRDGTGPSHFRVATYPVLAIDTSGGAHDGRRYVVYAEQTGRVNTDVQLMMRHSDDGMAWSAPVRVSDTEKGDQFVPWVDVDPLGGVHVAWYDRRNSPDNRLLDVYYAYSDNGGDSFHPNVRVTERSFDGDLGHHQSGAPFIGDYIGLDTSKESATVFWADTRHTGEAGRLAGSDVYAATILKDATARKDFDAAYHR
ncbi:MAG: sialidase family protein [bacterium]